MDSQLKYTTARSHLRSLVFALLTVRNAILWICFAPIQDFAGAYYGVSNSINGLSMSFMIFYLPGYFLAFWAMDTHGLRTGLCIAAVAQAVGAWVRYCSVIGAENNQAHASLGFAPCMIGQSIAAITQLMFTKSVRNRDRLRYTWNELKSRAHSVYDHASV